MKILSEYFSYLQYEKRYSKQTIIAYKTDITQFLSFCNIIEETDLRKIKTHDVREWLISLSEKDLSSKTLNRKITSLKRLFHFLKTKGVVNINPVDTISSLKVNRKLPEYVEEFNMNELLDDEERLFFNDDFQGLRDKMILKTFYFTGVRLSELINIKQLDIDFDAATLRVFGKRKKERLIPLAANYLEDLKNYIQLLKKEYILSQNFYVFLTNKGQQLYPKFVYRLVNYYLQKVTTLTKTSPHIIRHTFATHLLNNGADLNAIKELLGHSSLAATQVYTHNSIEKLKNTYNKSHPRN
jgi:integrase/recombinase XerC